MSHVNTYRDPPNRSMKPTAFRTPIKRALPVAVMVGEDVWLAPAAYIDADTATMRFEWDGQKNKINIRKHGLRFF
jgi:hypothetical protein